MPESTSAQLLSSETISSIAELWKLGACIVIAFLGYLFRTPINQILLNLRKIRSRNTEIDIASPSQEEVIQESSLSLSKKRHLPKYLVQKQQNLMQTAIPYFPKCLAQFMPVKMNEHGN